LKAGAQFLVSPGMSPGLRDALRGLEHVMIPGIATACEAMARHEEGFARLKLFPASIAGGAPALKALAGPLPHLQFMPTGGIGEGEVKTYLSLPNVAAPRSRASPISRPETGARSTKSRADCLRWHSQCRPGVKVRPARLGNPVWVRGTHNERNPG
jgi:2-keto-3-deoxy-6-phosphogluconate aldolase